MAPIDDDGDVDGLEAMKIADDREIVKELARPKPDPKQNIDPVFAVNVNGLTHPVSPNEEQMFQLFIQGPFGMAYNMPTAKQLEVPVDVSTCLKGISMLTKRHDILRSTYHMNDSSTPVRRIHNYCQGDCSVYYVDKVSDAYHIAGACDNARPHMLGVSNCRFMVFGVRNDRRKMGSEVAPVIGFNFHHVVADADSQQQALMELNNIIMYLFRGYSEKAIEERLPKLAVQFSDYAYWQLSLEARGLLRPDLAVWYSMLNSACPPMVLDVPLDKPRPRMFVPSGGAAKVHMDQSVLNIILEKIATTPYSLVFCNFTIALCRLTGQSRVNVAIPYGTRANTSLYPLIGNFLNMLPATFDFVASDSYGAALDRCSAIQLSARKYALAPFLTVVNMMRKYYTPAFDPSRNPMYQAMVDMLPMGDEESGGTLGGVLDLFAFAQAPMGQMKFCEVGYNANLYKVSVANRLLLQIKTMVYIAAYQATQGSHVLHSATMGKHWSTVEVAHDAASRSSIGSFALKINGRDKGEEKEVSIVHGFELKGTPDEYDFYRRSLRFLRHSGVMPTTDVGHARGAQYQLPPPFKKSKKGGGRERVPSNVSNPESEIDEDFPKSDPNPDWDPEAAEPLARSGSRVLEGVVDSYDVRNGFGLISCPSIEQHIPFFKMSLPAHDRPNKKGGAKLEGRDVAFTYYGNSGDHYAAGLRFPTNVTSDSLALDAQPIEVSPPDDTLQLEGVDGE